MEHNKRKSTFQLKHFDDDKAVGRISARNCPILFCPTIARPFFHFFLFCSFFVSNRLLFYVRISEMKIYGIRRIDEFLNLICIEDESRAVTLFFVPPVNKYRTNIPGKSETNKRDGWIIVAHSWAYKSNQISPFSFHMFILWSFSPLKDNKGKRRIQSPPRFAYLFYLFLGWRSVSTDLYVVILISILFQCDNDRAALCADQVNSHQEVTPKCII